MAIIAISREVAALGDEVAQATAKKLNYSFVTRKDIEKRIISLGFSEEKLKKYDEKKPSFFASLAKERDEYLDYLQTAVLEAASEGNCILIGRGAFAILEQLPNLIALRFISKDSVRFERLKKEFSWDEKQARQRITESDSNRLGFHKSFFNIESEDPSHFHMILNTSLLDVETSSDIITDFVRKFSTEEKEVSSKKRLEELLVAQHLVNSLIFEYKLNVNFLTASIENCKIVLHGVADSSSIVEKTLSVAKKILPNYDIVSTISVVQDFKTHP